MGKIILSAFADEYSPELNKQVEMLKEHGVPMIEPRFIDGKNISDFTEEEAKELRAVLDKNGIGVSSIGSPIGKIELDEDFEAHLEKAERTFKCANILGVKYIRMFSFRLKEGERREDVRDEVYRRLGLLLDLADKYGVTLCHENEAKIYGETVEYTLELLEHFGGRLRAVFDMGNFVLEGCQPYPYGLGKLKNYIEYFHIKDSLAAGAVVPPGAGEAHIEEILRDYKAEFDRDFIITLEPHLETFSGLNSLAGKSFENPYKYETPELAFLDALKRIKEIISRV